MNLNEEDQKTLDQATHNLFKSAGTLLVAIARRCDKQDELRGLAGQFYNECGKFAEATNEPIFFMRDYLLKD